MRWLLIALLILLAVPALAAGPGATDLTWVDNATNEAGYRVERAEGLCAPVPTTFTEIADLPVNAAGYRDAGTVLGKKYCYRVRAYNYRYTGDPQSAQFSGYSNLAGADYPFPAPAAATGLTAQ